MYQTIGSTGSLEETEWGRLPPPEEEGQYFESSKEGDDGKPLKFRKGGGHMWLSTCSKNVKIKVVGVWDTVGSLGYPDNAWRDVSDVNAPRGFQNTDIHPRRSASVKHLHTYWQVPEIENAFHALALEERRKPFALTHWWLPTDKQAKVIGNTNLIQYWFPGVHINIGGGSEDSLMKRLGDLEGMENITFAWMVDRCQPFLDFNPMNIMGTIRSYSLATAEVLAADDKTKPNEKRKAGWGTGLFIDSYDGIEDTAAGEEDRRPGAYLNPKPPVDKQSGAPGAYTTVDLTKECTRPVVEHLIQQGRGGGKFQPNVLKGFSHERNGEAGEGKGCTWKKTYHPTNLWFHQRVWNFVNRRILWDGKENLSVEIPEFVIPRVVSIPKHEAGRKLLQAERELIKYCSEAWQHVLTKEQQVNEEKMQRDDSALRFPEKPDADNKNHATF